MEEMIVEINEDIDLQYSILQSYEELESLQTSEQEAKLKESNKKEEIEKKKTECPICYTEFNVSPNLVGECGHEFCFDCMKNYINTKVNENQVSSKHLS